MVTDHLHSGLAGYRGSFSSKVKSLERKVLGLPRTSLMAMTLLTKTIEMCNSKPEKIIIIDDRKKDEHSNYTECNGSNRSSLSLLFSCFCIRIRNSLCFNSKDGFCFRQAWTVDHLAHSSVSLSFSTRQSAKRE